MTDIKRRTKSKKVIDKNPIIQNDPAKKTPPKEDKVLRRVCSRIMVIFGLLLAIYFSSKDEKLKTFAKQSEMLPGKGQILQCSPGFIKAVQQFEGCFPKECKRFVTDTVISVREADELLALAKRILKLATSTSAVSSFDFHSGALTMGQHFIDIYKKEEAKSLFTEDDFNLYRVVKDKVKYSVAHHFGVDPSKLHLAQPTFFSAMTNKEAACPNDKYWNPHVDQDSYQAFCFTTLIYLSDYDLDFKGGRFMFIDDKFNKTVEPRKGRLNMFTSGAENYHQVEKVTSGVRYAITIPFTCNKKYAIEDPTIKKVIN